MRKKRNRHKLKQNRLRLKEIRKENRFFNWFFLCFGLVFFISGLIKLLFFPPEIAVNARYLQPTIDNGGVICIVGFILLVCSIYRFMNKEKVVKDTLDLENDEL